MEGGLKPYGQLQRTQTTIQKPKLIINKSLLQEVNMLVGSGRDAKTVVSPHKLQSTP